MKNTIRQAVLKWLAITGVLTLPAVVMAQQTVHPMGDVFDTPPKAASSKGKPACAVAQKYVDLTAAGRYDELGSLFADDAVFVTPKATVLRGPAEIGAFYAKFLPTIKPKNVPISFIADGAECVMELVTATNLDNYAKYRLAAIDHFTVNKQGKIVHMVVYLRPQSLESKNKVK